MKYEYFIGLRYLKAKRRQTFVSVITGISITGVMVGVAALIIVLAGMDGVQDYMRDKILGFNAHLTVYGFGGIKNPDKVIREASELAEITGASSYVTEQVMLKGGSQSAGVMIRGIDPSTADQVMSLSGHMLRGSVHDLQTGPDKTGAPPICVGKELAHKLGVYEGSDLTMIIPEGKMSPLGLAPSFRRFQVACVYEFGFYQVDSGVALVNIDLARKLFKRGDKVDAVEIKTDNIYNVGQTKDKLREKLGSMYTVETWWEQQRGLFAALKMEQLLSGLVLSLIMLVACFNIVSMLLMVVMEKYRDIAILKSMGATDGGIMRIFITQGTIIGVIGTLLGVIVGVVLCYIQNVHPILKFDPSIYQFSAVPMNLTWFNVVGVALGAILLSFLTTLYPSWQAARSKPAESLRYE
ncbi:MAG: lipoprotein-releasing ABC transporter permease subunit [bacterium]